MSWDWKKDLRDVWDNPHSNAPYIYVVAFILLFVVMGVYEGCFKP